MVSPYGILFKAGRLAVKGRKKVRKVKGTKTYAKVKAKESSVRGAAGLKGSGRLNKIRRKVQGPAGYAALGAAVFSGDDE
tara:strand:+ start:293 stop:532 length:240 start_codon:yes stop_codon:yes gene_type:complete